MDILRAPTPFLNAPGRPQVPWQRWYKEFKIFAVATGWDTWNEERREALLLHCVGQEARRLYFAAAEPAQTEPAAAVVQGTVTTEEVKGEIVSPSKVETVAAIFKKLFPEKKNVHSERMLFRKCMQNGRSAAVYLTELQALSAKCAFGELQEQMMGEQFLEGCSDPKLRELLCKEQTLTSERVLQVAERLEMERDRHQLVTGTKPQSSSSSQLEIAAVTSSHQQSAGSSQCFDCGGPHRAADSGCPARWRKCFKCQKKGHYGKFCKDTSKQQPQKKTKNVRVVEELAVNSGDKKGLWTELRVGDQHLRMLADTGSAVSILPLDVYRKRFQHLPLMRCAVQLEAYGGSPLLVEGVVKTLVQAQNGSSSQASLYVVDAAMPLPGRDLQEQLRLLVVHEVTVCAVEEQNPEELPSIIGIVHRVRQKQEVAPVQQRLRPPPFALREEVRLHLEKLERAGIVERVDASPWISPIVVSRRRNGALRLRLCVDLRDLRSQQGGGGEWSPASGDAGPVGTAPGCNHLQQS